MPQHICCQKLLGVNMTIVSPVVVALGITNVILTYQYCTNTSTCMPLTTGIVLSWVGVGIWAPIATFFNGFFAVAAAGRCPEKGWLCLFSFFSTFLFTPALIIISALEVSYKFPSAPTANPQLAMYAIEITIAVVGGVLFLHALGILWINCCCKDCLEKHAGREQPKVLTQYPPQGPAQLQLLQAGVQPPPPSAVYRTSYYLPAQNQLNRNYSGLNYMAQREVLAGARW